MDRIRNSHRISRELNIKLAVYGALGITIFALLLYFGLRESTSSNASLLVNTQPVFTTLLLTILNRKAPVKIKIAGVLLGLTGIILVTAGGSGINALEDNSTLLISSLLLLGAALSMSLYNILLKPLVQKAGSLIPTFLSMFWGTVLLFICLILSPEGLEDIRNIGSVRDLILIIYLGTVATAFPYLLFNQAIKKTNLITASGYKFLIPVSGITLSMLLLGEIPSVMNIIGILIVLFSVILLHKTEN